MLVNANDYQLFGLWLASLQQIEMTLLRAKLVLQNFGKL